MIELIAHVSLSVLSVLLSLQKSGSTGGLIKEATHINKSLSFLEQVVLSLTKQAAAQGSSNSSSVVVSYRQSKLTYILKDSLGGNCNT